MDTGFTKVYKVIVDWEYMEIDRPALPRDNIEWLKHYVVALDEMEDHNVDRYTELQEKNLDDLDEKYRDSFDLDHQIAVDILPYMRSRYHECRDVVGVKGSKIDSVEKYRPYVDTMMLIAFTEYRHLRTVDDLHDSARLTHSVDVLNHKVSTLEEIFKELKGILAHKYGQ